MIRTRHFIFVLLALQLVFSFAFAAQIKVVKGKKILIELGSDHFAVGELLKIENAQGKYVGLAKVTSIKKTSAQAIFKGHAEVGFVVKVKPKQEKKSTHARAQKRDSTPSTDTAIYGGMFGLNMASASVKLDAGGTESLSGTGISAKAMMDYPLFPWLSFRGLTGIEQFQTTGSNNVNCTGGSACYAKITYLTVDLWGRYMMSEGAIRPWVGAGFDLMFPMTKKSTAIANSSISNIGILSIGGGLDWQLSETSYIPIQLNYDMFPPSNAVTAHIIGIQAGYATKF